MTREHKLALVVGFGLILFVGILVSDHLAADARGHDGLEPVGAGRPQRQAQAAHERVVQGLRLPTRVVVREA